MNEELINNLCLVTICCLILLSMLMLYGTELLDHHRPLTPPPASYECSSVLYKLCYSTYYAADTSLSMPSLILLLFPYYYYYLGYHHPLMHAANTDDDCYEQQ